MQNAAVYIRVSTDDQTEFSPDAQMRAIIQYAEKNSMKIKEEFIFKDEGISGRRADKRPGFQQMVGMAKLKPKPFDVILVHKFDRFARSREDSIVYKSLLRKECDIRVISITEQLEDDKFSVILEAMLEAMAEYYSLNLSDEVKKGMTEKAFRGELQTPAPFGYRMINGLLTPDGEEAEAVRSIFSRYVYNNDSLRSIASSINVMGFKTKRGNPFDSRLIEYIIYNPVYIGKIRWTPTGAAVSRRDFNNPDTIIVDGKHDGIVDEKLWQEANLLIRARQKRLIPHCNRDAGITTHWLRGLIKCSACGTTLSFGKGSSGRKSAFRCSKYLSGGCIEPQRITVEKLEKTVLGCIADDSLELGSYIFEKQLEPDNASELEKEHCMKQLSKYKLQLAKAKELVLSGIDTAEEYVENKIAVNEKIGLINKRLEELQTVDECLANQHAITGIYDILSSDESLTEKNKAISAIINHIVYSKKHNTFDIYYYFIDDEGSV